MNKRFTLFAFIFMLPLAAMAQPYIITGIGEYFNIAKGIETIENQVQEIEDAINVIKKHANGTDCEIQFGNGEELDLGLAYINFNSTEAEPWGKITISGKVASSNTHDDVNSVINLTGNTSMESKADIRNTGEFGAAIRNNGTGTVTISGGTISAERFAVYNYSSGAIIITGGTISATGVAVESYRGTITITGGTIEAENYAVWSYSDEPTFFGGSPNITGQIVKGGTGNFKVITEGENEFVPGDNIYTFTFTSASYSRGNVAVENGSKFFDNFVFAGNSNWNLKIDNNNIILAYIGDGYKFTKNGMTYTITKSDAPALLLQDLISDIKSDANGNDCEIYFGDGANWLDIGTEYINFNSTEAEPWGKITLSGKVASSNTNNYGVINLAGNASVDSKADIKKTHNAYVRYYAIRNDGTGTLTISGGIIEATRLYDSAVFNASDGTIIINKGTIIAPSDGTAVYNLSTGTIIINGGTISATETYSSAVYSQITGPIILGGNPDITGRIRTANENLSVFIEGENMFAPASDKVYSLDFYFSYSQDFVAVKNGKDFLDNFTTVNGDWCLAVSGNNLILERNENLSSSSEAETSSSSSNDGTSSSSSSSSSSDGASPVIISRIASGQTIIQATSNAILLENLPNNAKVQIYNLKGRRIYSANSENSQILQILVQTKGLYFVKINNAVSRIVVR